MKPDVGQTNKTAQKIRGLVAEILRDDDFYKCHTAMGRLSEILGDITQITIKDDENLSESTMLDEGHAISPVQAAKCITQITRTRQFWLAIKKAIEDQLFEKESIDILYAGTGPYGTIVLPLLPFLEQHRIRLTCLDIHEVNTVATNKIIDVLDLELEQLELVCGDATKWRPDEGKRFDIIISETMNAHLCQEPQVSIFAHLEQFLRPNGHLIPQQVVVEAWLAKYRRYQTSNRQVIDKPAVKLKELLRLDRDLCRIIRKQQLESLEVDVSVPEYKQTFSGLELRTDIHIYQGISLTLNQCTLNAPKTILPVGGVAGGQALKLIYRIINPNWQLLKTDIPGRFTCDTDCYGRLGVLHLRKLWCRAMNIVLNRKIANEPEEVKLDFTLVELLGLQYSDLLELVGYSLPDFNEFEYLLEDKVGLLTEDKVEKVNFSLGKA